MSERTANALDRKLGQRVRTRRLKIGMSQERLAELLGVTFQQVQKYEKGVNRIAASRLFDIAGALDAPIAPFFDNLNGAASARGAGAKGRSGEIDEALATPDGMQLMALYASIKSVKLRRRVIELVRALKEDSEA